MLIPVLIISSLVHVYSVGYMSNDPQGNLTGQGDSGDELSNSGEQLKLKVPSCNPSTRNQRFGRGSLRRGWKTISGWSNYSGKVTNLKICENKMGDRGSKSTMLNNIVVKEQRVSGSLSVKSNLIDLRCTLKGFERNLNIINFNRQMCWSSCVNIPSLSSLYEVTYPNEAFL
jgi:hypothetical protein